MRTFGLVLSSALPIACCVVASASAQQAPAVSPSGADWIRPVGELGPLEPAASPPFAAAAVDDRALGSVAGREDTLQVAQSEQAASVSRNNVGENAVTGDARIDGNAFQNMSGLSILSVNTGNNVAINSAMTVNISIHPGP